MTRPGSAVERLIALARSGDLVLAEAGELMRAGLAGDPAACIRARRLIESRLDADGAVARAGDYHWAASVLRDDGYAGEAMTLAIAGRLERELAAAEARWRDRYAGPVPWPAERELPAGQRVLRLGPAARGIDGALYQAGGLHTRRQGSQPVVMMRSATCRLLLGGWEAPGSAWAWMHGRLADAGGPLAAPAAVSGAVSRLAREEQVLALVLRAPWLLDEAGTVLHRYRWSCHARDEIFAAARTTAWRGRPVSATSVTSETASRYAWAPAWAREEMGGPDAPFVAAYVAQLARTHVDPVQARAAMYVLARQHQQGERSARHAPAMGALIDRPPGPQPDPGPLPRI